MIKKCLVFLLLLMTVSFAEATVPDSNRKELMDLLNQRKELFDKYTASLDKKSGFFGNRTKGDLKDSKEWLEEIVTADNKIMNVLNRTLNYRNFEKLNMTYDASSYEDRIKNLTILNDTLNSQMEVLKKQNKAYGTKLKVHNVYFVLIFILLIGILYWRYKKRFSKKSDLQ